MAKVLVRQPFVYDADVVSHASGLKCEDESLTVQADKDSCDINVIMKNYTPGALIPQIIRPPIQGEYLNIKTMQEAMDLLNKGNKSFMTLSSKDRARFEYDPAKFVDFCSDPENLPELRRMGLAPEPPPEPLPPAPTRVIVVPEPPKAA